MRNILRWQALINNPFLLVHNKALSKTPSKKYYFHDNNPISLGNTTKHTWIAIDNKNSQLSSTQRRRRNIDLRFPFPTDLMKSGLLNTSNIRLTRKTSKGKMRDHSRGVMDIKTITMPIDHNQARVVYIGEGRLHVAIQKAKGNVIDSRNSFVQLPGPPFSIC